MTWLTYFDTYKGRENMLSNSKVPKSTIVARMDDDELKSVIISLGDKKPVIQRELLKLLKRRRREIYNRVYPPNKKQQKSKRKRK